MESWTERQTRQEKVVFLGDRLIDPFVVTGEAVTLVNTRVRGLPKFLNERYYSVLTLLLYTQMGLAFMFALLATNDPVALATVVLKVGLTITVLYTTIYAFLPIPKNTYALNSSASWEYSPTAHTLNGLALTLTELPVNEKAGLEGEWRELVQTNRELDAMIVGARGWRAQKQKKADLLESLTLKATTVKA